MGRKISVKKICHWREFLMFGKSLNGGDCGKFSDNFDVCLGQMKKE